MSGDAKVKDEFGKCQEGTCRSSIDITAADPESQGMVADPR